MIHFNHMLSFGAEVNLFVLLESLLCARFSVLDIHLDAELHAPEERVHCSGDDDDAGESRGGNFNQEVQERPPCTSTPRRLVQ